MVGLILPFGNTFDELFHSLSEHGLTVTVLEGLRLLMGCYGLDLLDLNAGSKME